MIPDTGAGGAPFIFLGASRGHGNGPDENRRGPGHRYTAQLCVGGTSRKTGSADENGPISAAANDSQFPATEK